MGSYSGRTCTRKLVISMTKYKNLGKSLKIIIQPTAKNIARGNVPYFTPPEPSHLENLT